MKVLYIPATHVRRTVDDLLGDFREISPRDTARLFDIFSRSGKRAWCYYAPFLTCYHSPPGRQVLVGDVDGSTVLLARTERKQLIYNWVVPPVPFDTAVFTRVDTELRDLTSAKPRILWCDAADVADATAFGYCAEEKELEYFYDPKEIVALEGRKFRELRKRIHRAERRYLPECRDMVREDVGACRVLLDKWRRLQGRRHDFLLDWGYTRIALDRFGDWGLEDLAGWVVTVEGKVSAFGMAGRMAEDQACFFIAKSDPELPGMSELLRLHVHRSLSGYRRVNDAGDLNLEGLRQHKMRFRPVEMRPVYTLYR